MNIKSTVRFKHHEKTDFFQTLRKRVDSYFKENKISKNGNSALFTKTFVLFALYVIPFVLILTFHPSFWVSIIYWVLMGIAHAGIGMNVMHDANHGSYSSNRKINDLVGFSLNLLGGSIFNWKNQHNVMHHTFTNVNDMDEDIDSKGAFRFNPHARVKFVHKMQWLYAFVLYGLLTFYWVTFKDFIQFRKHIKTGVNSNTRKQNFIHLMKIVLVKICYFFVLFGLPMLFLNFSFLYLFLGFFIMHFVSGNILALTFQLAHTVEGTSYPVPDESGTIHTDWAIHQLSTTANFSRGSRIVSWFVGGLNYQVEHHLFPNISHVHYPAIAEITKQTATEYNVPYLDNGSLWSAIRSHIRTLKSMGRLPTFDEIMD